MTWDASNIHRTFHHSYTKIKRTKDILGEVVGKVRVNWLVLTLSAPRNSLKGLLGRKRLVGVKRK